MCLHVLKTRTLVAKRPVEVFKVLVMDRDGTFTTPFQCMLAQPCTTMTSALVRKRMYSSRCYSNMVAIGLHAYRTWRAALWGTHVVRGNNTHCASACILRMHVPTGAQYILGDHDHIVADELLWEDNIIYATYVEFERAMTVPLPAEQRFHAFDSPSGFRFVLKQLDETGGDNHDRR